MLLACVARLLWLERGVLVAWTMLGLAWGLGSGKGKWKNGILRIWWGLNLSLYYFGFLDMAIFILYCDLVQCVLYRYQFSRSSLLSCKTTRSQLKLQV